MPNRNLTDIALQHNGARFRDQDATKGILSVTQCDLSQMKWVGVAVLDRTRAYTPPGNHTRAETFVCCLWAQVTACTSSRRGRKCRFRMLGHFSTFGEVLLRTSQVNSYVNGGIADIAIDAIRQTQSEAENAREISRGLCRNFRMDLSTGEKRRHVCLTNLPRYCFQYIYMYNSRMN